MDSTRLAMAIGRKMAGASIFKLALAPREIDPILLLERRSIADGEITTMV